MAFGWKPPALALVEVLRRLRQRWLRPVRADDRGPAWIPRARAMRAQAKVVRTTIPDPTSMLDHFESHYRSAILTAKAHADRVLVVRQSWFEKDTYTTDELAHFWHGAAGRPWREEVTTFYSLDVPCRLMALLVARVDRIARDLDVEQIDLHSVVESNLRFYYDWLHLTPAGAKVVADAVAAAVLRSADASSVENAFPQSMDLKAS